MFPVSADKQPQPVDDHATRLAKTVAAVTGRRFFGGDPIATLGESQLCQIGDDIVRTSRSGRWWQHYKNWELNRAFYEGNQWAIWHQGRRWLEIEPDPSYANQKRSRVNLYKNFVITAAARMVGTRPAFLAKPRSSDQKVLDNAQLLQMTIDAEWERQRMTRLVASTMIPAVLEGTYIWCCEWDPHDGEVEGEVPVLEDGQMVIDFEESKRQGKAVPRMRPVHQGNVVTRRVNPRHFLCDMTVTDDHKCIWQIEDTPTSVAAIYRTYGVRVSPDGEAERLTHRPFQDETSLWDRHTANVRRVTIMPGNYPFGPASEDIFKLPRGVTYTYASGRLLEFPGPLRYSRSPYIVGRILPLDDSPFGDTVANEGRSPQALYNRAWNQVTEANDYMALPIWLRPSSSQIDGDFPTASGSVIDWDDSNGIPPQRIDGKGAAASVFRGLQDLMAAMYDLWGQHPGGIMGGAPGRVDSGVGLESLKEGDTGKMALTTSEFGRCLTEWSQLTTEHVCREWDQPRLLTVLGPSMEPRSFSFTGNQVPDGVELKVVDESILPQSRTMRMHETLLLLQYQVINIQDARRRIARDMVGELSEMQAEINYARDENRQAKERGRVFTPVEAMSMQDHEAHMREHMLEMNRPEVRPGPHGISQQWLALFQHWQVHAMLLEKKMAAAEQQQPGKNGKPASPSPGGKPAEDGSSHRPSANG